MLRVFFGDVFRKVRKEYLGKIAVFAFEQA